MSGALYAVLGNRSARYYCYSVVRAHWDWSRWRHITVAGSGYATRRLLSYQSESRRCHWHARECSCHQIKQWWWRDQWDFGTGPCTLVLRRARKLGPNRDDCGDLNFYGLLHASMSLIALEFVTTICYYCEAGLQYRALFKILTSGFQVWRDLYHCLRRSFPCLSEWPFCQCWWHYFKVEYRTAFVYLL